MASRQDWRGLECVANTSEGRDQRVLRAIQDAAGDLLLDTHSDEGHNRSVLTLCAAGSSEAASLIEGDAAGGHPEALLSFLIPAVERVATTAVAMVDLRNHEGAHPRLGSMDVVPFVSLRRDANDGVRNGPIAEAIEARERFMSWAGSELGLPCFAYGPERSLPEIRRKAFVAITPDTGPTEPHPTAGSCAVGARPLLVAYNLWLSVPEQCSNSEEENGTSRGRLVDLARSIARSVRGPAVRALGLLVGSALRSR